MDADWVRARARSLLRLMAASVLSPVARPHDAPLLVLGNQKSGTTAVAAALADALAVPVTQDLIREVVRPTVDEVVRGERSIDWFVDRNSWDFRRPIVKEPNLTLLADQLRRRFPDSSVVGVVRNPVDNIRSILDRIGVAPTDVEDALDRPIRNRRGWELVLDSSWYGGEATSTLGHLCNRWNRCAAAAIVDEVVTVRYEDFVDDRRGSIRTVLASLGRTERGPVEAEDRRQHQPAGRRRDLPHDEIFTAAQLREIGERCGPLADQLGYG